MLALLPLYSVACAQPRLIEDHSLNQGRLREIVRLASSASGLSVIEPLSVELVTRHQLSELLQEARSRAPSNERALAEAAMGMRSDGDLSRVELFSRIATGAYLASRRTLYLVSERPQGKDGSILLHTLGPFEDEIALAHEVVHALQHQHFPHLFEPGAFPERQADAATALEAAIEGAATYAAARTLGYLGGPRDPDQVLSDSLRAGPDDQNPLARERLMFPYTYGYRLAYFEGNGLLVSPPASTEQVIHLEGGGGRRSFVAMDLSELGGALQAESCRILSEDTMGELGLSLWLRSLREEGAGSVVEGWDGDRWMAAECPRGKGIAWLTSWDTEEDAVEFQEAIEAIAGDQRSAEASLPWLDSRHGREVLLISKSLPMGGDRVRGLARRARVSTREELKAHILAPPSP